MSYCIARKVAEDIDYWIVPPADRDDTRAYVNLLFSRKGWFLMALDVAVQAVMLLVLIREVMRVLTSEVRRPVRIPLERRTYWEIMVGIISGKSTKHPTEGETLIASPSRLRLSKLWLSNPFYIVACIAYGIGSTVESQMIVEVLYWQYTKSGNLSELIYAGMYSMRQSWVGIGVHAILGQLVVLIHRLSARSSIMSKGCAHIHDVNHYVSSKTFIVSFFLAAIITTRARGFAFLRDRMESPDVGMGLKKNGLFESEIAHNLMFHHAVAQCVSYVIALGLRFACQHIWSGHRSNSLVRAFMQHSRWAGFDIVYFLAMIDSFLEEGRRFHLVCSLSEVYQLYSNLSITGTVELKFTAAASEGKVTLKDANTTAFCVEADSSSSLLHIYRMDRNVTWTLPFSTSGRAEQRHWGELCRKSWGSSITPSVEKGWMLSR